MASKTPEEKEIKKIERNTIKKMQAVGTYRPEFDAIIRRYAELTQQYNKINIEFYATGCKATGEYTNKSGFTNNTETALFKALDKLRNEIDNYENIMGLTPLGLKKIKTVTTKKKVSKLGKALSELEQ